MARLIVKAVSGESKFVDIAFHLELFVSVSDSLTGVPIAGLQPRHFRLCSPTGKVFGTKVDTCVETPWEKGNSESSGCYALSIVITQGDGGEKLEWMEGEFYPFGVQVRFSDDTKEIHMGQTVVRVQSLGT
jgi:hypothetical protein